jgi:hypothetical protein
MGFSATHLAAAPEMSFLVSPDALYDHSFLWSHFVDLSIERDANQRDETVIFSTSTKLVVINGMHLQGLFDALRSQRLTSLSRDTSMAAGEDPFVRTVSVNDRQ